MTKSSSPLESYKNTKKDPAIQQAQFYIKPEGSSHNKKHEDSSRTSQDTGKHPATSSQQRQPDESSTTKKDLAEENSKTSKPAQAEDVFSDEEHQEFSQWMIHEFDWGPL